MSTFSRIPLHRICRPKLTRAIQTSADTTQLNYPPPTDPSKPFTVQLHQDSFHTFNCDSPSLEVEVTKEQLLSMYKQMQTMRRMEMAADALYKAKLIRGFCHLAIGQVRIPFKYTKLYIYLTSHLAGSCICRSRGWYQTRGPCHHRLPMPPLRCHARWYDQGCHC